MPIPISMADLSVTASANSPQGTESPTQGDDFLRNIQSIIRSTNAKGADIVSAPTTDIGAATGEFVDVTGTATITSLGTAPAGIVRTVRFTGASTLTHNAATLILPNGANIINVSGNVAQFRSLGAGSWVCVGVVSGNGGYLSSANGAVTGANLENIIGAGTVGSATLIPAITYDENGRVTAVQTFTNKAIGVNQTWQDVTASRAFATNYTNTTGRGIFVLVRATSLATVYSLSITSEIAVAQVSSQITSGNFGNSALLFIREGATYRADAVSMSLTSWIELR